MRGSYTWGSRMAVLRKAGVIALVMVVLWSGAALAHGPRYHKVRLVRFPRPPPAPEFQLPDDKGGVVALKDFRGQFLLLNFWATWCPPCVREMPSMERLSKIMGDRSFTVLGISLDKEGPKKVLPFIKRLGVTFPIAFDTSAKVSGLYGARDLPSTFLIDPQGRVVAAAKGARDWAADDMVAYLKEVISSKP